MKKLLRRMSGIVLAIVMVFTLLPSLPTVAAAAGNFDKQTITMHFKKPVSDWDKVCAKLACGTSWNAISQYSKAEQWPGIEVPTDSANTGWYTLTIDMKPDQFDCIFNNGNNGKQTENICFTPDKETTEKWVEFGADGKTQVSEEKPADWKESDKNAIEKEALSSVKSPVVNDDKTVTFNLEAFGTYENAKEVSLRGTVPGTDWDNGVNMTKTGKVFSYTTAVLNPGVYEYKYVIDGEWKKDPVNPEDKNGNSKLVVPGLESKALTVTEGSALELPDKLNLYKADGNEEQVGVTYKLKDTNDKVTLDGNKLTVAKKSGIKEVKLVATAGSETSEITAKVVAEQYTYNIYFYDSNAAHMDVNAADVHMWEIGGSAIEPVSFTEKVKFSDGNEWLKASITTDLKNIGMIPRSKGEWSWQTDNHTFNNTDANKTVDLYIVYGDKNTYTKLPAIKEQRERKVIVEYERQIW